MSLFHLFPSILRAPEGGDTAPPGGGGGAPPGAPPAAPPGAPPPDSGTEVKLSSAALKNRLDEERAAGRRALLKEYGLEKQDDLKGRLDKLKALEDEKLSTEERNKKQLDEATARAAAGDAATQTAQAAVDALFATLSETDRAAIEAQEPKTAAERLRLIAFTRALRSGTPAPGAPTPGAPPPATTTPSPGAPKPGAQKTAFEKWSAMPEGSMQRDFFYRTHGAAIEASRPA